MFYGEKFPPYRERVIIGGGREYVSRTDKGAMAWYSLVGKSSGARLARVRHT